MANIRVNTETLRSAAQRLDEASERLREQGERVQHSASAAGDYDGQFGPQVRQMAAELQADFNSQATHLRNMSARLLSVAEAFEAADLESQSAMTQFGKQVVDWIMEKAPFLARLASYSGYPTQGLPPFPASPNRVPPAVLALVSA